MVVPFTRTQSRKSTLPGGVDSENLAVEKLGNLKSDVDVDVL